MSRRSRRTSHLGLLVTIVAVSLAIAHLVWPAAKIDAITVLLVVVALLPWLGGMLESIELPGGWKVIYRKLEERVTEVASTAQAAFGAVGATAAAAAPATSNTIRQLTEEYWRLRALPRTQARTDELDRLFGTMAAVVPTLPGFDVAAALQDDDAGMRLAGYAYLHTKPDPTYLQTVVATLDSEKIPFNQYWAIRTLRALVGRYGSRHFPGEQWETLWKIMNRLPEGSTRRTQLAALLGAA
jgi:hypothetical protein